MADWFKVDAYILDDPKVRFCISSEPYTLVVFFWCLCTCCREKRDRFEWAESNAEIRGLAELLHITDGKIIMCLRLLAESNLIQKKDGFLIVTRWAKHQSDYLNRKAYFSQRYHDSKNSTVKHSEICEQSEIHNFHTEERSVHTHTGEANVPSWGDVKAHADMTGVSESSARAFYNHHEGNNLWVNQYNRLINWQQKLASWWAKDRSKGGGGSASGSGHKPKSIAEMTEAEVLRDVQ